MARDVEVGWRAAQVWVCSAVKLELSCKQSKVRQVSVDVKIWTVLLGGWLYDTTRLPVGTRTNEGCCEMDKLSS